MKDVLLLTKVLLRGSKTKSNGKAGKFKKMMLMLFGFVYLMGFVGYACSEMVNALVLFEIEYVFLKFILMAMFTFFIMQSAIASLNILFFSKDIESLLPLPIKPYKIVMAKMNCLIVSEYLTSLMMLVPALVVYGYTLKLGISYYISALLIYLLLPIVPVIAISLIVTIIMKITKIVKNKNFAQYLSIFLTLVLIFAIEAFSGATNDDISSQELANAMVNMESKMSEFSIISFPVRPLYEMLINYDNINIFIEKFVLVLFFYAALYIVGSKTISSLYLKIITTLSNGGSKQSKINEKTLNYKRGSIKKSFSNIDFKMLQRNPHFHLQCLIMPFLMAGLISISVVCSFREIPTEELDFIKGYINDGYPIAIILAIITFFYAFNYMSITAISRDGENAKVYKYLPIDFEKFIGYKTLIGIKSNFIIMLVPIVGLKVILGTLSIQNMIILVVLGTIINVFNNYIGVLIDLKNPKLHWLIEHEVVKQNMNMLLQMAFVALQVFGIVYLGFKLQNTEKLTIIISLAYAILLYAVKLYIRKNKLKLYENIN